MHSENIAAYVGLDVHKETLAVAIAAPERLGEVRYYGTINNEAQAVRRLFQKLQGLYGNILSCYEAGPCGFRLYHQLTAMNIKCQVIAPFRIPKSPTDRIKNDHRDAISLARLLRAGELTPVWTPDLTHEAMRDLIRARAAAKRDSRVARQRILSMLLRTDKHYAGKHRTWNRHSGHPGHTSRYILFSPSSCPVPALLLVCYQCEPCGYSSHNGTGPHSAESLTGSTRQPSWRVMPGSVRHPVGQRFHSDDTVAGVCSIFPLTRGQVIRDPRYYALSGGTVPVLQRCSHILYRLFLPVLCGLRCTGNSGHYHLFFF
ncbi:transposase [Escherichia coli]|nr:transposase [Escherichia coli 96.0497]KDV43155.1 hypothetical protein BU53_32020 [Escherichia coli O91:H21 str. 2009C-3740]GDH31628.1 transposase [Escherichia coli]GDI36319.1 transposase [Escherichia coli]GDI66326.1 transposase [Escherichia coli]